MGRSAGKLRAGAARGAMRSPELLRYEMAKLEQLKPNPKNPRIHSERQIKQIARSIEEFGSIEGALGSSRAISHHAPQSWLPSGEGAGVLRPSGAYLLAAPEELASTAIRE